MLLPGVKHDQSQSGRKDKQAFLLPILGGHKKSGRLGKIFSQKKEVWVRSSVILAFKSLPKESSVKDWKICHMATIWSFEGHKTGVESQVSHRLYKREILWRNCRQFGLKSFWGWHMASYCPESVGACICLKGSHHMWWVEYGFKTFTLYLMMIMIMIIDIIMVMMIMMMMLMMIIIISLIISWFGERAAGGSWQVSCAQRDICASNRSSSSSLSSSASWSCWWWWWWWTT